MIISIALILANPVFAKEFERLAGDMESQYNIKRLSPKVINFVISFIKPIILFKGVTQFKIAAFENNNPDIVTSLEKLESVAGKSLGSEWKPFIGMQSNRKNSTSIIFLQTSRRNMRLLLTTIEEKTVALIHMKMSKRAIMKFMDDPESMAEEGIQ